MPPPSNNSILASSSVRVLICTVLVGAFVIVSLWFALNAEKSPQVLPAIIFPLFVFFVFCVPILVGTSIFEEVAAKTSKGGWLIVSITFALVCSIAFLLLGIYFLEFFTTDLERRPILIGRSLEFLSPFPKNVVRSNACTYFPLIAVIAFFLPFLLMPLLRALGMDARPRTLPPPN